MSPTIKLEAFTGWPPTTKCQELVNVMEEVVRRYPDEARFVCYRRGVTTWSEPPSMGLKALYYKGSLVPACFVDGEMIARGGHVPTLEQIETELLKAFGKNGK